MRACCAFWLSTLSLEGAKLTATYDFTPDDWAEVALKGTFDADAATGTWVAREQGERKPGSHRHVVGQAQVTHRRAPTAHASRRSCTMRP